MFSDQKRAALAATLVLDASLPAQAGPTFNRIASFPVNSNLPADADPNTVTASEIIAASEDGMTLVYSDSPFGAIGFIDITEPAAPLNQRLIGTQGFVNGDDDILSGSKDL
jgi:hypothetical protein